MLDVLTECDGRHMDMKISWSVLLILRDLSVKALGSYDLFECGNLYALQD